MRILARRIERRHVGPGIIFAERRSRLHRVRDRAVIDEVEFCDMRRLGEGRVGRRLVAYVPVVDGIVGRKTHGPAVDRASLNCPDRWPPAGRRNRRRPSRLHPWLRMSVCDHNCDRVSNVEGFPRGEGRECADFHWRAVLRGDGPAADMRADLIGGCVGAGQHSDDALRRQCRRDVDGFDRCMSMRRTHESA